MATAPEARTPEEAFTDTHARYMRNWNVINSLRMFADAAVPFAKEVLAIQHEEFMTIVTTDPEYKIFGGGDKPLPEEFLQAAQTHMTTGVMTRAGAAIDAASIVFAQSVLDDCAWSYLRVCAMINPADWEAIIDAKKVDLKAMRERGYEEIRAELIQAALEQMGRESLLRKIDLLFKLCPPPKGYAPIGNYEYDRERLERIDRQRHAMIHENGFGTQLPTVEEDLTYMSKTAWLLMGLLNKTFGLQLDSRRLLGLQAVAPQEVQPDSL